MKIGKLLAAFLLLAGGPLGVFAEDLTVTDLSKPAELSKFEPGSFRAKPWKLGQVPSQLKGLPCVSVPRGDWRKPGRKFSFKVNKPVTVYLLVHIRGDYAPEGWLKTDRKVDWPVDNGFYHDLVYKKDFAAGTVEIPEHDGMVSSNSAYGIPNLAVIKVK